MLIYSEPFERWKCVYQKCNAQCCVGGREVTAGDIDRISKATGQKPEEFSDLNHNRGLFRLKSANGKCIFLDGNSCTLHKLDTKPIFCRMYPFKFDGIIYSDEIVLKVRVVKGCPGFEDGTEVGDDFEIGIEELGNKFIKELKDFLKKEGT